MDVTFFAPVGPVAQELIHPKITVVCLEQSDILRAKSRAKAALQGIWNTEAVRALYDVMATMDPQTTVMHIHSYIKAISPAIGPLMARGMLKNVFTMHDYFLACPNGGFYDYQKGEICTRKAMSMSCLTTQCDVRQASHKVWRVFRQAVAQTVGALPRGLEHIIYISEFQKKIMEPYLPTECRMYHVANPVEVFSSRSEPRSNAIFLFVGRLNPEKGAVLFAQAAQMAGAQAVFVGDGQDRDKILEANPNAQILGWKSPSEVQDLIETARCVVFPSLWYECQPLVPIEALHAGVPVIAGRWTAASETVENNHTGLLVDTPDVEAFASAITALLDDAHPVFRRIQSYVPSYTPEAHQQALLGAYSQVLQS